MNIFILKCFRNVMFPAIVLLSLVNCVEHRDEIAVPSIPIVSPTLVSITVTPANTGIAVGTTQQFKATGTFSNNSTRDLTSSVTWSSLAEEVADLSSTGLATAVSLGSTTITAASGGISGSTSLTVAEVISIGITPASPTIAVDTTQQFTATGTLSDGSFQDLTPFAIWNSSDAGVATISNASGSIGLVSAAAAGTSEISAEFGSVSGMTTLTVKVLVALEVTPVNPTSGLGTTKQLTATGTFSDSTSADLTESVIWTSSNTDIATVNNIGLATCLAVGSTSISATAGSISGSTTLTVSLANRVYVTNSRANSVSVIDASNNTVITDIAVGSIPHGIAVNALTSRVYVTNSGANSVSVIDASNNTVITDITVGSVPHGVAVNASTNRVYVTNSGANSVSVIDANNNTAITDITVGSVPEGITVNASTNRVYATNSGADSISVINASDNTVITDITVGSLPQGITVNASTNRVYVTNSGGDSVSVIDANDNTVISQAISVENDPQGIAVDPLTDIAYVANNGSGNLSIIDVDSNNVSGAIFIGSGITGVVVAP